MADKGIPVTEATAGTLDKIDMKQATNGASETVYQQRVVIAADETTALANPLPVQIGDGTHNGTVKAASTESAFGDVAVVVAQRPTEAHVGEVGGNTTVISPTLAVSTTPAYTAGDNVGGLLTLTGAVRISGGTGVLQSVSVTDHGNQKAALEILIFESSPTGTFTDNAASPTLAATELAKILAKVSVAATDYVTLGSAGVASLAIGKVVKASGSANLYAAIVTTGTPTYVATSDLNVRFGFLRD